MRGANWLAWSGLREVGEREPAGPPLRTDVSLPFELPEGGEGLLTIVVLLILVLLWAVVLIPPLMRARVRRSQQGIGTYSRRLGALGLTRRPASPSALARGAGVLSSGAVKPRTARRRRDILSVLGTTALVSLAGAAVTGETAIWTLFMLSALALASYLLAVAMIDRGALEPAHRPVAVRPGRVRRSPVASGLRRSVRT